MTRNRIFAIGCLGALVLIVTLIAIICFSVRGPYDLARARWDEKGSADYTLVVEQYCFCMQVGVHKITVQSGRVTGFEVVTDIGSPFGPSTSSLKTSDFDRMTIAAMLSRAATDQSDAWSSPWTHRIDITYDPTYGYVTDYSSDANGELDRLLGRMVTDSGYSYTARDLVITQP